MLQILKKLLVILPALLKILNTLVEVLEDFADDGKRNYSNSANRQQNIKVENSGGSE